MAALLELKEKIRRFYGQYNTYILPAGKFLLTLIAMLMLSSSIGFMSALKSPLISVAVAAVCAFLPAGFMVVCLSLVMVVHLYSISAEFALVTLGLIAVMYFLYFRLAPRTGYLIVVTVLLCFIKLPYLAPIALGLTVGLPALIPAGFGVVIYYIVRTASAYEAAITEETVSNTVQKFTFIIESFAKNKDMLLILLVVLVAIVFVSVIKRMSVENAWNIAIAVGAIAEFIIVIVGKLVLQAQLNVVVAILGILLSTLIGYICELLFFNLDYKRTEFVQFEDDEYYYYVKAVPKVHLVTEDVRVKRINAQKTRRTDDIAAERPRQAHEKPRHTEQRAEEQVRQTHEKPRHTEQRAEEQVRQTHEKPRPVEPRTEERSKQTQQAQTRYAESNAAQRSRQGQGKNSQNKKTQNTRSHNNSSKKSSSRHSSKR